MARRHAFIFFAGLLTWLLLAVPAVMAQGQPRAYALAPGDKVRVQFLAFDNQSYVATVDLWGNIRLPYLGSHRAAGKSLDALTQDIVLANAERQFSYVRDGVSTLIVFDQDDFFLDIEAYRPVTVTGAVDSPGRVAFEPGLTVRGAIASAGGPAFAGEIDENILASYRVRLAELQQTEAWLLADLWRVQALLSGAPADQLPEEFAGTLTGRLDENDLLLVRERIANARDTLKRDAEDIEARIELTRRQIEFLESALVQYQTASEIEEARLQNILQLSDRGLVTANALDDARDGALNVSSRLLTTQADLAEAERQLQALQLAELGLLQDFNEKLMAEKTRSEMDLAEARARLKAIRQEIAIASIATSGESEAGTLSIVLHRRTNGEEASREVAQNELLQPGDALEVLLRTD